MAGSGTSARRFAPGANLRPPPGPAETGPDIFERTSEVLLRTRREPPFPESLVILDPYSGAELARLRSDAGPGGRVVLLKFVLEEAGGRPIYSLWPATPRTLVASGDRFLLLDPPGAAVAELGESHRGLSVRLFLREDGSEILSAQIPTRRGEGFPVLHGSDTVASVIYDQPLLPTPQDPDAIRLRFESPLRATVPRRLVVAFVAYLGAFRPERGGPA